MDSTRSDQLGYLLVGHGTRDPIGQAEFREVVRLVADRLPQSVAGAFLELAEPTIAEGLNELCQAGVRRVLIVPLLLFSAGHAKRDVPDEVAQAAAKFGLKIVGQSGALELHPQLLELSRLRFRSSVDGLENKDPQTKLLMVGRGGSDAAALEMMRRYTAALSASLGIAADTAYVALAKPSVEEALETLATSGATCMIVQPHLLFAGEVMQTIHQRVTEARQAFPHIEWSTGKYLGPHPLLVDALIDQIAAVSLSSSA